MKYYSELTKTLYNTPEDLKKAEDTIKERQQKELQLKADRAKRAKEVTDAYEKYCELKDKFIADYGSFHMTYSKKKDADGHDEVSCAVSELLDNILNFLN